MAGIISRRKAASVQPRSGARVDWGNPLSLGLYFAWTANSDRDAVRGAPATLSGTSLVGSRDGLARSLSAGSSEYLTFTGLSIPRPCSIVVVTRMTSVAALGSVVSIGDGTSHLTVYCRGDLTPKTFEAGSWNGSSYNNVQSTQVPDTVTPYVLAATFPANGDASRQIYVNGVNSQGALALGSEWTGTSTRVDIGRAANSQFASENVLAAFVYKRQLSASEVKRLSDNPWQLFAANSPVFAAWPDASGTAYALTAASGSFAVTGNAVGLKRGWTLAAATGSYALTGNAVNLSRGWKLTASPAAYTLSGSAINLSRGWTLSAAAAAFTLTGSAATLTLSHTGSYTLVAQTGSFVVTPGAATLTRGYRLSAAPASYTISASAIGLTRGIRMTVAPAAFSMTGYPVRLVLSAAVPVPTSLGARYMVRSAVPVMVYPRKPNMGREP